MPSWVTMPFTAQPPVISQLAPGSSPHRVALLAYLAGWPRGILWRVSPDCGRPCTPGTTKLARRPLLQAPCGAGTPALRLTPYCRPAQNPAAGRAAVAYAWHSISSGQAWHSAAQNSLSSGARWSAVKIESSAQGGTWSSSALRHGGICCQPERLLDHQMSADAERLDAGHVVAVERQP